VMLYFIILVKEFTELQALSKFLCMLL
jgi:hypothetical protein